MAWKPDIIFNFEHKTQCTQVVVEQPAYTLVVYLMGCRYVEKSSFFTLEGTKGDFKSA
jgi:hypothetical protein